jgi:hypothetical protein
MALRMEAGITSLPPSMILTACADMTYSLFNTSPLRIPIFALGIH